MMQINIKSRKLSDIILLIIMIIMILPINSITVPPAYSKGIADNATTQPNPDTDDQNDAIKKKEAEKREKEDQDKMRKIKQDQLEQEKIKEAIRIEEERREQERIAFEEMQARIREEQEREAQRLREEKIRLEQERLELERLKYEQELREEKERNEQLAAEEALRKEEDERIKAEQDSIEENNITEPLPNTEENITPENNSLNIDEVNVDEIDIFEAYKHHLKDHFYYPYDIYSYTHYPFDQQDLKVDVPKNPHITPARLKKGSVEETTYDISFAWLNKNPAYLMRHTTKYSQIKVYYSTKKSHTMNQAEYYYMTNEAFKNIDTNAMNFKKITKGKIDAKATAIHEFYTGNIKRRVTITYHLNKINGVWLINRIDILPDEKK